MMPQVFQQLNVRCWDYDNQSTWFGEVTPNIGYGPGVLKRKWNPGVLLRDRGDIGGTVLSTKAMCGRETLFHSSMQYRTSTSGVTPVRLQYPNIPTNSAVTHGTPGARLSLIQGKVLGQHFAVLEPAFNDSGGVWTFYDLGDDTYYVRETNGAYVWKIVVTDGIAVVTDHTTAGSSSYVAVCGDTYDQYSFDRRWSSLWAKNHFILGDIASVPPQFEFYNTLLPGGARKFVYLLDSLGLLIGWDITTGAGIWHFANLRDGSYYVHEWDTIRIWLVTVSSSVPVITMQRDSAAIVTPTACPIGPDFSQQRFLSFYWGTYGVTNADLYKYNANIVSNTLLPGGANQAMFLSFDGLGQVIATLSDNLGIWTFRNLNDGIYNVREGETTRNWKVVVVNHPTTGQPADITITRVTAGRGTFAFVGAGG
jgi:hypothetical protein